MSRCFSAHIFHFSFAFVNEILMLSNSLLDSAGYGCLQPEPNISPRFSNTGAQNTGERGAR